MGSELLDEYEAAAMVGMSPKLLRYFSSYAVKKDDSRKLVVAKKVGDTFYFEADELIAYDNWLKQPWPADKGKRPHLPKSIRSEIKQEANLECALCKASGQAGEAAHIRDVAISKNNHPHNLIWLCANHHTKLDNGSFGPKGADNSDIRSVKKALQYFSRHAWLGQAQISRQIAATLSLCETIQQQLRITQSSAALRAIEDLGGRVLNLLPKLASYSDVEEVSDTLQKLTKKIAPGKKAKAKTISQRLVDAVSFEDEFLEKSGLKRCPLCEGTKAYNGDDCPVCHADGAIDEGVYPDLVDFKLITCQLCDGRGVHEGEDCPVCHGEGELERRFSDMTEFKDFDKVDCPLCKGRGSWKGDDCRECHGERKLPRWQAGQVDVSSYKDVKCPLCNGKGLFNGDDCPVCRGECTLLAKDAANVDLSDFDVCKCRLCKGSSTYNGGDCPACGGYGEMTKAQSDATDFASFKVIKCPKCNGKGHLNGYDCRSCGGYGETQRRFADRFDDYY